MHRTRTKVKGGWEVHTPKSGKGRRTPLPRALADDLRAYLAQHPHADDLEAPLWPGRKITGHSMGGITSALRLTGGLESEWRIRVVHRLCIKNHGESRLDTARGSKSETMVRRSCRRSGRR